MGGAGRPVAATGLAAGPGRGLRPRPRRLETLGRLLRHARALRVYGPVVGPASPPSASAWELALEGMRLALMVSPEPHRGFSGEGAVLDALAGDQVGADADLIGALLAFEPRLEVDLLAERSGLSAAEVPAALGQQLGTAGRVGYDLAEAAYFHRELPHDAGRVERRNPRLANARALAASGAVSLDGNLASVVVDDHEHRVRFDADGAAACTCPWWARYRGSRSKCKHVLAAELARAGRPATLPAGTR